MSSNSQKRKIALERFKNHRQEGRSALDDDNDDDDDGEMFDYLSEKEYAAFVEARREREDFVVDDDGLGYYDDGEEYYGGEAEGDDQDKNKRKRGGASNTAALTAQALKKARKNLKAVATSSEGGGGGGSKTKKDGKIYQFWGPMAATAAAAAAAGGGGGGKKKFTTDSSRRRHTTGYDMTPNVDELLKQLDQPDALPSSSSYSSSAGWNNRRATSYGRSSMATPHAYHPPPGRRAMSNFRYDARHPPTAATHFDDNRPNDGNHNEADNDNCNNDFPMAADDCDDSHDHEPSEDPILSSSSSPDESQVAVPRTPRAATAIKTSPKSSDSTSSSSSKSTSKRVNFAANLEQYAYLSNEEESSPVANPNADSASILNESSQQSGLMKNDEVTEADQQDPPSQVALQRPRRSRKLGQLSGAAQRALDEQERQQKEKLASEVSKTPNNSSSVGAQDAPGVVEPNSSLFVKPTQIAAEAKTVSTGQLQLQDVLVVEQETTKTCKDEKEAMTTNDCDEKEAATANGGETEATTKRYVDMFWMDIAEKNGDILLFGKVPYKNGFVSAMLWVTGHKRNLFVLPRPGAEMTDVHQEINTVLHDGGNILPRAAGVSWAGKVVQRNYAFEDPTIPRSADTNYLKVVYDAKYPVPSEDICTEGGEHFARILGAGASNIENFIIKRKLKGPSWIRISHPFECARGPISHTKVEFQVDSPKCIVPIDDSNRKPPPMVTMSLKLKTVVNPTTHKSEVVSVSAICHRNVPLDSATSNDLSNRHMTQLSLIRPLSNDTSSGASSFPLHLDLEIEAQMPALRTEVNERALLSRLFLQIGQWDPDVIVGHNAWGYDLEVLLSRAGELKIRTTWSKLGRRMRTDQVNKRSLSSHRDLYIAEVVQGRMLVDTYLSAKELLNNETTYSLSNLAATCLKTNRTEIESVDIPSWFLSSKNIVQLAKTTLFDAELVQRLLFRLQVLPLTFQLTCIAGNLWSHTLRSNRAERTEYLLLHEFHQRKYLVPEKPRQRSKQTSGRKAKYSGGLVLEPKRGFYDSFILLLDFNSLYPSLIQEYNLCFTTVEKWAESAVAAEAAHATDDKTNAELPQLPGASMEQGVLPKVIKSLVERRRLVKRLLKQESSADKKAELDVRQKALKLTANSMYGCLGFSNSRFFAQPIAALVTSLGRETLQKTVDIAQNNIGLDVIYGDTDSIMINTRISDLKDISQVTMLGERVKKEVNRLYKTIELEIDAIFRSMLLLKKKKYAAKTVEVGADGTIKYGQELKGLDLVRRDWCVQSKDTGRFVIDLLLSGNDAEAIVSEIYNHLEDLGKKMRNGELPLEKYIITKGLNKHPNDYPDAKSQPHVQVAKMMLQNNRPVNTGDHIPYIITAPLSGDTAESERNIKKETLYADRARHPEEVARSQGKLKPDVVWYLQQQILPPISRLCEPIDAISNKLIAEKLGLDGSNIPDALGDGDQDEDELLIEYKPASLDSDTERFKDVEKLQMFCMSCRTYQEFPGVSRVMDDNTIMSGLVCTNQNCASPSLWGHKSHFECFSRLENTIKIWVYKLTNQYYDGKLRCNEPSCQLVTRQVSVAGGVCLRHGCTGRLVASEPTARDVRTHLKYLETLFDIQHTQEQILAHNPAFKQTQDDRQKKFDLTKELGTHDKTVIRKLHETALQALESNDYNWISASFWTGLFKKATAVSKAKQ
ncbi:hypothetical protein ACA910_019981 [Epithemia clementina (nom. ined.)]